ncbi:MAG TPA: sigma-70 family RNA polymerase sigma factor [Pyrinomonadaceae bacterium]|nr:sigma-70 family RNA polymerase sigma factor [Pyrinomonadaceae bacterium]
MTESAHVNKLDQEFDSWEAAYVVLRSPLTSTALRLTNGNLAAAEDLVQSIFCRALGSCPDVKTLEHPLRYLRVGLHHTWMKKHPRVEVPLEDVESNYPSLIMLPETQEILENREVLEKLFKAGFLRSADKQLLKALQFGYTLEEIAAKWGEDAGLTRVRWSKIIAKLRYHFREKRK